VSNVVSGSEEDEGGVLARSKAKEGGILTISDNRTGSRQAIIVLWP
jgi:hypothetical protein